jgi:hypothetical protein
MNDADAQALLARNRVILTHFDSYSTALLFPLWPGKTLLWPQALPEGATPMAPPANADDAKDAGAIKQWVADTLSLNIDELVHMSDYVHWAQTSDGPVRIHLLRFDTFEPPKAALAAHEAEFKHLPQLRGCAMSELNLLREVFNLIVGGGSGSSRATA